MVCSGYFWFYDRLFTEDMPGGSHSSMSDDDVNSDSSSDSPSEPDTSPFTV